MTERVDGEKAIIRAREFWNDTGVELKAGVAYVLSAEGRWRDLIYRCGPEGFESPNAFMRHFEARRRVPGERWFALMGAIDCDASTVFRIGASATVSAPRSGTLTCFANDVPFAYVNNFGSVVLTVRAAKPR